MPQVKEAVMAELTKKGLAEALAAGEISVEVFLAASPTAPTRNGVEYRRSPSGKMFSILGNNRRVIRGRGIHLFKGEMDYLVAHWDEVVEAFSAIRDTLTDPPSDRKAS